MLGSDVKPSHPYNLKSWSSPDLFLVQRPRVTGLGLWVCVCRWVICVCETQEKVPEACSAVFAFKLFSYHKLMGETRKLADRKQKFRFTLQLGLVCFWHSQGSLAVMNHVISYPLWNTVAEKPSVLPSPCFPPFLVQQKMSRSCSLMEHKTVFRDTRSIMAGSAVFL